ncbi:MAG: hypothetical protein AAF566_05900 [Pseudomonadota bacterium]
MQLRGRIEGPCGAIDCAVDLAPTKLEGYALEGRARIPQSLLKEFGENPNGFRFRAEDGRRLEQFASPFYFGAPMECLQGELVIRVVEADVIKQGGAAR